MSRNGIYSFVYFFIYLFVQVLILKKLVLFNTSFCFLYVAFILLLPIEINNLINLVREKFNTTSIIITHDLTCAKNTGDRIAMLLDGKFLKQGTFEELFNTEDERIQNFYNYNFVTTHESQ